MHNDMWGQGRQVVGSFTSHHWLALLAHATLMIPERDSPANN